MFQVFTEHNEEQRKLVGKGLSKVTYWVSEYTYRLLKEYVEQKYKVLSHLSVDRQRNVTELLYQTFETVEEDYQYSDSKLLYDIQSVSYI